MSRCEGDCAVCEMGDELACREDATCPWMREFTPEVVAACGRALLGESVFEERPADRPPLLSEQKGDSPADG